MGMAKRLWEEEMAREYHTSDDNVCAECFDDLGIRAFIADYLKANSCSVCGRKSENPIAAPADEVMKYILKKIHEHYENVI